MTKHYQIAVIGDWHLAFVTSGVFASLGQNTALIKPLNLNPTTWTEFPPLPVMEPGLSEMMAAARSKNHLSFENGVNSGWTADYIWMAVDTPVNDQDEPDVTPLWEIADQVAKFQRKPKAFFLSSQIPIGFCTELEKRIGVPVIYVPENLRLGKGIETFLKADRTVLGCNHPAVLAEAKEIFKDFPTQILECNLVTSEMVKHANNAFLATSISFANELARIGEKFGVDSVLVGKALKLDKRIGNAAYVIPGLGFAGGTLPRDLRVLQSLGKQLKVPTQLVDAVLDINERTTLAISDILETHISKAALPKKVLILGYTYKADTDTLRRSLSIDLAKNLSRKGFELYGFDPIMNGKDLSSLSGLVQHFTRLEEIPFQPSVIICMTARPQFKDIPWAKMCSKWTDRNRILLLDTQNHLLAGPVLEAGMNFQSLWSPLQPAPKGA